jgi:hypothetical protein
MTSTAVGESTSSSLDDCSHDPIDNHAPSRTHSYARTFRSPKSSPPASMPMEQH